MTGILLWATHVHAQSSPAADVIPANANQVLPELGNNPQQDRLLLREITDDHVYRPAPEGGTAGTSNQSMPDSSLDSAAPGSKRSPTDDAWDRIRQADRLPLSNVKRVVYYRDQYTREAIWISKILHRGKPFLAHLIRSLEKRFLPVELALLPAIESGYRPDVLSAGNAAGIWQIVPITAREIGIERNTWFDGRADIKISTTAALDYLSYLNADFQGNWELTLAAYNAGPGRVKAAIRKNKAAGKKTDFWSLDLPKETRNYVPKLIALIQLIKDDSFTAFDMPQITMQPAFEQISLNYRISIDKAAEISDIPEKLLRRLNAGLIHGVTAPHGPHELYLPAGSSDQFRLAFNNADRTRLYSLPHTHQVVAGDSISSIAHTYGISQRRLRELNGLDNSRILIGQSLAVIDARHVSDTTIDYVVNIGDTLSEIAEKFSVRIEDITNNSGSTPPNHLIHPGETLRISIKIGESG